MIEVKNMNHMEFIKFCNQYPNVMYQYDTNTLTGYYKLL